MLELLVACLMMFGVSFSKTDTGQIQINGNADGAMTEVRKSDKFEPLGGEPALNAVIVNDGTDGKE